MKLNSVSLKEHTLGTDEIRKADGLAWFLVELVLRDNLGAPNSVPLRNSPKTILLPVVPL